MNGLRHKLICFGIASALVPGAFAAEIDPGTAVQPTRQEASSDVDPYAENYCFGGFSRRNRVIPSDGVIHNQFKQTTSQDCQADGGTPVFMPDLKPTIPDGKLA